MPRSKSSNRWLQEHFDDYYVQKTQFLRRKSRASFKLEQIQAKDKLIAPGDVVVDLGAAPGGWTDLISQWSGLDGAVFALDILPMDLNSNVNFVLGDFTESSVKAELLARLKGRSVNVVLSDMAPNMSGNRSIDQPRAMELCDLALDFCRQSLCKGGHFLIKVFQGEGFDDFFQELQSTFDSVKTRKPDASRARSRETYILAQGFKGY